jgi:hypothetical protein
MIAGKKLQGMPVQTRTIFQMWNLVAMLVLLDWAAVARAQDAAPAPPPAPAPWRQRLSS